MKARVEKIESARQYKDKQRRITLNFIEADSWQHEITVKESALGIVGIELDMELEVKLYPSSSAMKAEEGDVCPRCGSGEVVKAIGGIVCNMHCGWAQSNEVADEVQL